eukprot:scaffold131368_cov63-Phaeocystis_antarctica.AAC.3
MLEDLPLHGKGELRRGRMEHDLQRRAAQRDAHLARLGDLCREPRCKQRQEGGSQHAEVERVIDCLVTTFHSALAVCNYFFALSWRKMV